MREEFRRVINLSAYTQIRVTWIGDPDKNWLVTKDGVGIPGESYRTKQEAIKAARKIASSKENRPSALGIEYKKEDKMDDGEISDWQIYRQK